MADFNPTNTDIVSPKEFIIEDVNLYTEHMDYYFDVQVNETAKNFTEEELSFTIRRIRSGFRRNSQ